jgi:hypothetical protein
MRVLLLPTLLATCHAFENMNGDYVITPTPNAPTNSTFSTRWSEYKNKNGGVQYFEVYLGPITTLYSQVWWKALPTLPLPPELIKRFDGKGMAVVGYEVDSVRKGAGPNGEDVSVPVNMACASTAY